MRAVRSSTMHGDDRGNITDPLLWKVSLSEKAQSVRAKFYLTASVVLILREALSILLLFFRSTLLVLMGVVGTS